MKRMFLAAMLAGFACGEAVEPHMSEITSWPWVCTIWVEGEWFSGNGNNRRQALRWATYAAQPAIDAACAGQTGECQADIHTHCSEHT